MTTKSTKIVFWISTIAIFLFEGILVLFTSQTELAKEGIRHLGYPEYFGVILAIFKVCGTLILIIPKIPPRVKEWAYAGFGFDFTFAFLSILMVDGVGVGLILPLFFMIVLIVSYKSYHRMKGN